VDSTKRPTRLAIQNTLPALAVLLIIALVGVVSYYLYVANRNGALMLSNDLVTAIEKRVSTEMYSYLEPSKRLAELIDADVDGRPVFQRKTETGALARNALARISSAAGVSFSDTDGNLLYVRRKDDGNVEDKLIDRRNGAHRVTVTQRTAGGDVISSEEIANDTFDPRERPWYIDAVRAGKPIWTNTYQNLTLQRPAISYVIPRLDKAGKPLTVIGIDIAIDSLCGFLSRLKIGNTGKAYIIDHAGHVVALPSAQWQPANTDETRPPRLDEIGDPVLARAYLHILVEGFGRHVLDIDGRRMIVSSEPVKMFAGNDWLVLIVVPESDFLGFVTNSSLVALAISIVIVTMIVGLAGLLGWRNVIAGRRVAIAALRQHTLEKRAHALIEVGRRLADKAPLQADLKGATETAAEACDARSAAIWRMSDDRRVLTCQDYYERDARHHSARLVVQRDEVPALFAALDEAIVIDTMATPRDERVVALVDSFLRPRGIEDVYIAPIMLHGQAIGMLSVEDAEGGDRAAGMAAFCDALAVLLALKLAGVSPAEAAPVPARPVPTHSH
jgi:hypothetical protein